MRVCFWKRQSRILRSLLISALISLVLAALLTLYISHKCESLPDQTNASTWGNSVPSAEVSAFFPVGSYVTDETFLELNANLKNYLETQSITNDAASEDARLYAYAYSGTGSVTLSNGNANVTVNAIGTSGDFFLFHMPELINGSYYRPDNNNTDYIILDENTAWQLFGGNDLAGKLVYVGNTPLVVAGVWHNASGRAEDAAGVSGSICFMDLHSLQKLGNFNGIGCFELVMPNPVKGFALAELKELLSGFADSGEFIENSNRFSLKNRILRIKEFGTRSMNTHAVIYPYWENLARGLEDILTLLTFVWIILLSYGCIICLIWFIIFWYSTVNERKESLMWLINKIERFAERVRAGRLRNKREEYYDEEI